MIQLNEVKQLHCLEINCLSLLVDVIPNLTLFRFSWTVWFGKWSDIPIINIIRLLLISLLSEISRQLGAGGCHYNYHHSLLKTSNS